MLLARRLAGFFSEARKSPVFKIRASPGAGGPAETAEHFRALFATTSAPFVIADLRKFGDTPEQLSQVRSALAELKKTNPKPIYVWNQSKFSAKLRSQLPLLARNPVFQSALFRKTAEGPGRLRTRLRLSPNLRALYEQRWARMKETIYTRRLLQHYGYATYSKGVEKLFPNQELAPPTNGYLRELIFEPRKFAKRMMKSKYMYYFIVFKVLGWIIKGCLLVYFFYIKPRRKQEGKAEEPAPQK